MSTILTRFNFWLKSVMGPSVAGAELYLCAQPTNVTNPPSPLIPLFADSKGITPLQQPLITDGQGYAFAYGSSQIYTLVVVDQGVICNVYPDQVIFDINGTETLPPSGSGPYVVTSSPSVVSAPAGDIITADGAGNVQDSGVQISNLAPLAGAAFVGPVTVPSLNGVVNADYYATLTAALAATPTPGTLQISSTLSAPDTLAVPSTVTLQFIQGGMLNIASGKVITINGFVDAGTSQIFTGAGTVAGLKFVMPEWLGSTATVYQAILALNATTGGTVQLQLGTYTGGFTTAVAQPHVTIQGSGRPGYNSLTAPTALVGGTIILGTVSFIQGSDFVTVRDLGVDVGPAYVNAFLGGTPVDGLEVVNNGQVVSSYQVQSPRFENVACLGYNTTAPNHCMLMENVNDGYIHNVTTIFNEHGVVLKGTNSNIDGVYAKGHGIDSLIVKSDAYAPAGDIDIANVNITYLATQGDTKGIIIQGVGAALGNVNVNNVTIESPLGFGIQISGAGVSESCTVVNLSNIIINYSGGSPSSYYGIQFVAYVADVSMSNIFITGMWAGIAPNTPESGFVNDFRIVNSQFTNIATNAIESYGRWNVSNCSFIAITETALLNDSGVMFVSNNTFASVGTNLYSNGGTFAFGYQGVLDTVGNATFPAGIYAGNGIFGSTVTTSVVAHNSATVLTGSGASSGLLVIRDNTSGGSALFLIDPNSGAQLFGTSQITGLASAAGITWSSSVWNVTLTTGTTPRSLAWTIYST